MTIALHTMVKNGREKIPALLKSVVGFCDKAIILDTGSTDGTREFLEEQKVLPCEVFHEPFVNFGVSRTRGLELCKGKADWILLLDDDMTLRFDSPIEEVKAKLNTLSDCYLLRVDQPMTYWTSRVISGHRAWEFVGVTHEYLNGSIAALKLSDPVILHKFKHGPEKFTRDAALLAADIARDPDNSRTIFYLAQTFRDSGKPLAAIRYYELRVRMGGWVEEIYFSMYESARLANDPNAMERAFAFRPCRAEPCWWLREFYNAAGRPDLSTKWEMTRATIPMTKDILFVYSDAYGPRKDTGT